MKLRASTVLIAGLALSTLAPLAVLAQEVVTQPAAPTVVNLGPLYDAFMAYVVPGLGTLIGILFAWLAMVAKQKFGLQIDDSLRAGAQTALTNAAARLIVQLKGVVPDKLDVNNAFVAQAVNYVITASPDWVKKFGLGPDDVKEKLEAAVAKLKIAQGAATAPAATGSQPRV